MEDMIELVDMVGDGGPDDAIMEAEDLTLGILRVGRLCAANNIRIYAIKVMTVKDYNEWKTNMGLGRQEEKV
jgi:hypothetical protein